jgi:hypothetical protein
MELIIIVHLQKSHIKNQDLPAVPDATNPLSLTKDEYSVIEDPDNTINNHDVIIGQGETSSDGYTLLAKEGDEPGDTGNYDTAYSHYEMSGDPPPVGGSSSGGTKTDDDDHDYEEPYWEPATKEEELMEQLANLNVPVIPAKNIE